MSKTPFDVYTDAFKPFESAFEASKKAIEDAFATAQKTMESNYESVLAAVKEQSEKANTFAFKGYDDFAAYSQANIEAILKSGQTIASSFEGFGKAYYGLAQEALETAMATAKDMAAAKNPQEIVELQSSYTQKSFDKFVVETQKMSEMSTKVANEALEPIQARVTATVEKVSKAA